MSRRVRVHPSALTAIQRPSHRNRTGCVEHVRVDPERDPDSNPGAFQDGRASRVIQGVAGLREYRLESFKVQKQT